MKSRFALATLVLLSACTMAKISGRGSSPLLLNNPTQKVTVLDHFTASKRIVFDYTNAFDVSQVLGDEMRKHPGGDAVTNLSITVKSGMTDFFINVFTLGLAQAKTFEVEGDLVKLGGGMGTVLKEGMVVGVSDSLGVLRGNLADFHDADTAPTVIKTEAGLVLVRHR